MPNAIDHLGLLFFLISEGDDTVVKERRNVRKGLWAKMQQITLEMVNVILSKDRLYILTT